MAFNKDFHFQKQQYYESSDENIRFDELSSSGADTSEWILFSPSMNEFNVDVLSSNNEIVEDDDLDEAASLLESINNSPIQLSLPRPDQSGQFNKTDFITNRIDVWRREQARILIDDLNSDYSRDSSELLASWGVEDPICNQSKDNSNNKRFYGDDIFKKLSPWEVDKIKSVAKQMSSSLKRVPHNERDFIMDTSLNTGRRLSIILNLSKSSSNQPFWKKDLSSVQSSLSLDTGSIMFGLHFNDVA